MVLSALAAHVGKNLEFRGTSWQFSRVAGDLCLPDGRRVVLRSKKAGLASLLAWAAFADPTLAGLRLLKLSPEQSAGGDIVTLLAHTLVHELLRVLRRRGVPRRYLRHDQRSVSVRGRILFERLAREVGNHALPPCRVWDRRPQTPLNRILATAVSLVDRHPWMRPGLRAELAELRAAFEGIAIGVDPRWLQAADFLDRLEEDFAPALALAKMLLRCQGSGPGGERVGFSYLVRLDSLFERAVVMALRLAGLAGTAQFPVPYRKHTTRGSMGGNFFIDFYCTDLNQQPLVVDAKYRSSVSPSSLQQMVSYCFLTGALRAVLVYPAETLAEPAAYRFSAPNGQVVSVEAVGFDVSGISQVQWQQNARNLTDQLSRC